MKAIGYNKAGEISNPHALESIDIDTPVLGPRDILVEVKGISVNPVDIKVRGAVSPESGYKVIGYDAAGVVNAIGAEVELFAVGDEVFYAGDLTRPGTNMAFHAVDERIVGRKPASLDFAEAAALPLTSITAWELLFDCFRLKEGDGSQQHLLVIGAAGGVGSILIQLVKKLTNLTVIATASREATVDWVKKMGADMVINHREPLQAQLGDIQPEFVASLNGSAQHFGPIVELIAPRGHIALIDDPGKIDISVIKTKALSFSWEFMFTRPMFQTRDMDVQHQLLNRVSELIDEGILQSTMQQNLGPLSVENLIHAHKLQESGTVIGKNVLGGFE